jgi:hypothetical protein
MPVRRPGPVGKRCSCERLDFEPGGDVHRGRRTQGRFQSDDRRLCSVHRLLARSSAWSSGSRRATRAHGRSLARTVRRTLAAKTAAAATPPRRRRRGRPRTRTRSSASSCDGGEGRRHRQTSPIIRPSDATQSCVCARGVVHRRRGTIK